MKKNKLIWLVREMSYDNDEVGIHQTKPVHKGLGELEGEYWASTGQEGTQLCYPLFLKATGLKLEFNKPVRVRFSVEVV